MTTCLQCGELSDQAYCAEHRPAEAPKSQSTTERGYGHRWQKLSQRARRIQPFCSDCGTTENLTADHSPEAWERYYAGKTIPLSMIEVVCGECNNRRGPARPGGDRSTRSPRGPLWEAKYLTNSILKDIGGGERE